MVNLDRLISDIFSLQLVVLHLHGGEVSRSQQVRPPEFIDLVPQVDRVMTISQRWMSTVALSSFTDLEVLAVNLDDWHVFGILNVLGKFQQAFTVFTVQRSIDHSLEVSTFELNIPSSTFECSNDCKLSNVLIPRFSFSGLAFAEFHPVFTVALSSLPWTFVSVEQAEVSLVKLAPSCYDDRSVVGSVRLTIARIHQHRLEPSHSRFEVKGAKEESRVICTDEERWVVVVEGLKNVPEAVMLVRNLYEAGHPPFEVGDHVHES